MCKNGEGNIRASSFRSAFVIRISSLDHVYNANEKVEPINVAEEVSRSFLDYSMSVIISRALPDARDGLKPSQRRILYAMHDTVAVSRPQDLTSAQKFAATPAVIITRTAKR